MIRPEFSQVPALIKEIGSQIGPLNLVADLVVERPFSFQETLRVNLRDPVHERRPEAMYGVSQGHLSADQRLHGVIRLAAGSAASATAEDECVGRCLNRPEAVE